MSGELNVYDSLKMPLWFTGAMLVLCGPAVAGSDVQPKANMDTLKAQNDLVKCQIRGRIKKLSGSFTYIEPSKVLTISEADCSERGGTVIVATKEQ